MAETERRTPTTRASVSDRCVMRSSRFDIFLRFTHVPHRFIASQWETPFGRTTWPECALTLSRPSRLRSPAKGGTSHAISKTSTQEHLLARTGGERLLAWQTIRATTASTPSLSSSRRATLGTGLSGSTIRVVLTLRWWKRAIELPSTKSQAQTALATPRAASRPP